MNDSTPPSEQRDRAGRFASGNRCGRASRFAPGQSGNLSGRPPGSRYWISRYAHESPDVIRKALAELASRQRKPRRRRGRVGCNALLGLLQTRREPPVPVTPVKGADPRRSKLYGYRLAPKADDELLAIYHDPGQPLDRREGARLRLAWPWRTG